MKNKLLKNPQHVAQLGYNPFALHRTVDRSDTTGQLTPCYYDWLQPGDKVDASVSIRTRTLPLVAPASASFKQCVDWFFVPATQILSQFGNWFNNVRDEKSDFYADLTANNSPQNLPSFSPWTLLYALAQDLADPTDGHYADAMDSLRLADCLGIPLSVLIRDWNASEGYTTAPSSATTRYNIFFPAAYQKIYFDYYRLSDREANDPSFYNFDSAMKAVSSPSAVNAINTTRLTKLFKLHYVPYRKDYFTNLFISPIQGQKDLSSYGVNPASVSQWLTGLSGLVGATPSATFTALREGLVNDAVSNPTTVKLPVGSGTTNPTFNQTAQLITGVLNAPNVSTLFAVQKMLEISRRAGKHFDAQTLAHYGVNVPTGISGEVMHLGHFEQPFVIGDVISTASTKGLGEDLSDGADLGEMAGKGYCAGSMQVPVKFTAPYHGVLMAIHYVVPDVVYAQTGCDKLQTYIAPQDWPRPEVDSLGMQPLFGYESNPVSVGATDVLGWQYRYQELKMKYNVAYGAVHPDGNLHYWALTRQSPFDNTLLDFLVPPTYLNDIMVQNFSYRSTFAVSTPCTEGTGNYLKFNYSILYTTDPLVTHFAFNVKKSSKMSSYGLLPL